MNGERIVQEAKTWLGTPYADYAKVKGRGTDCGMILIGVTEGAGLVPKGEITIPPYSNEWHLHRSEEMFYNYLKRYCREVAPEDMQAGDFLLYQYGRCMSHGGIYCGDGVVIHAVMEQGVIASGIDDIMFYDKRGRSRLRKVFRYEGGGS